MKQVIYSTAGEAVPDYDVERCARKLLDPDLHSIHVSTENVVMMVRVLIREKVLDHNQVCVPFGECSDPSTACG